MITMEEILKDRANFDDLDKEIQNNLAILLDRINILRRHYGKSLKVNDGLRIKGKQDYGAKTSKHYTGQAIDLDDDDKGTLMTWVLANLDLMKEIGLWMEDPRWTHGSVGTWMHFQTIPPKSGKRIFVPSSAPASAPGIWDGKYDSKHD